MMQSSHKRILVIDDSADIQALLTLFLEAKGYTIECRSNGEEALTFLNSDNHMPDVILVDLQMPIMNGFTFLNFKRQIAKVREIPTVIMTGEEDTAILRLQTSHAEILKKPLTLKSVLAAIDQSCPSAARAEVM